MSDRVTISGPKLFIAIFTALTSIAAASPAASAADDCLEAPGSTAPQGRHWRYHLDRQTQRKCWYLGVAAPAMPASHAAAAPAQPRTTANAARPSAPPPAPIRPPSSEQPALNEPTVTGTTAGTPPVPGWPGQGVGTSPPAFTAIVPNAAEPAVPASGAPMSQPSPEGAAAAEVVPPPPSQQPDAASTGAVAAAGDGPSPTSTTTALVAQTAQPSAPTEPAIEVTQPAKPTGNGARPFVVLASVLALAVVTGFAISRWLARRRDILHRRDMASFAASAAMRGGAGRDVLRGLTTIDEVAPGAAAMEVVPGYETVRGRRGETDVEMDELEDSLRSLMHALRRPAA